MQQDCFEMMFQALAFIWIGVIGLIACAQTIFTALVVRKVRAYRTPKVDDSKLPKAAILLCLRGVDPFLKECLDRLAVQDYPNYEIWIALDSTQDPARPVVEDWLTRHSHLAARLIYLADVSDQASLKTNCLRYTIRQLDASIGAVVLVDADTMVNSAWLRNMVSPLLFNNIGVVTGNRWYDPLTTCWGSLVRYIYNAFSMSPMYLVQAIWPGSLSMHRNVFAHPDFLSRLRRVSSEDDVILRTLRDTGMELCYSADCIMLNREECQIGNCYRFIQRQ
ncbi:MAG: glycosyltransferase family 2 protein, partial [Planctomycetales bacterium]